MAFKKHRALIVVTAISMGFAWCMLWIALAHNPQQEFYGSELGVNWNSIVGLWLATFIAAFALTSLVTWLGVRAWRAIARGKEPERHSQQNT